MFARQIIRFTFIIAVVLGGFGNLPSAHAEKLDNDVRVALHAELRRHLSSRTDKGIYMFAGMRTDAQRRLSLKRVHPVIFRKASEYLMCADFVDEAGKDVLIDFIVIPDNDGYRIVREIEGQRSVLTKIFEKLM